MPDATSSDATSRILTRKQDGIGWLTINQPEKRNAISLMMWGAIAAAAEDFAAGEAVRVVVIHGAGGKAFTSGADISEFDRIRADARAQEDYGRRSARPAASWRAWASRCWR